MWLLKCCVVDLRIFGDFACVITSSMKYVTLLSPYLSAHLPAVHLFLFALTLLCPYSTLHLPVTRNGYRGKIYHCNLNTEPAAAHEASANSDNTNSTTLRLFLPPPAGRGPVQAGAACRCAAAQHLPTRPRIQIIQPLGSVLREIQVY